MATPRTILGIGEDTDWFYTVVSNGEHIFGWQRHGPKRVHSGKKNGGPWYSLGLFHDVSIPDDARNVSFTIMIVNRAKEPSTADLEMWAMSLRRLAPIKMESAGQHGVFKDVATGATLLGQIVPGAKEAHGLVINVAEALFGSFTTNHDAVVFFDTVIVAEPQRMEVGKLLEFAKQPNLGGRAQYEVKYKIIRGQ